AEDLWWNQERLQRLIEHDYAVYGSIARTAFASLEKEALARVAALQKGATEEERRKLSQEFAGRQGELVGILTEAVARIMEGPVPPRADDPRGTYLAGVEAAIEPTTTAALLEGGEASDRRLAMVG